jgi:hypothetical protein
MPCVRVPRHVAWLISPLVADYSALRRLVVDYFASAAHPGTSARRAAHHAACRAAHHRLLRLAQACHRLLRLRRVTGCHGTSRGPSRGSSSTTPCGATSSCGHAGSTSTTRVRRDYLSRGNTSSTSSTPRAATTSSSSRIASTIHLDWCSKLVENGSRAPNI